MMMVFIIGVASETTAQGRGYRNDRDHHDHRDDHTKNHWKSERHGHKHNKHRRYEHRHHRHSPADRRVVHYHDRHCHHAPVAVRHYHERPRYIYYRDYNVYHDLHRDVFITWSGRNWAISASLPVVLNRVDTHRAVRMEVDYAQDDFVVYLQTHKPSYRRVYTGS